LLTSVDAYLKSLIINIKTKSGTGDIETVSLQLPAQHDDLVADILRILGAENHFRGPWELLEYLKINLWATLIAAIKPPSNDHARIAASVSRALRNPVSTYRFSAPLSFNVKAVYEGELGGDLDLRTKLVERNGFSQAHIVPTGSTRAATSRGALFDAERAIEEVVGAALALGFAALQTRVPGTSAQVAVEVEPRDREKDVLFLSPELSNVVTYLTFALPTDLTDLEQAKLKDGDYSSAAARVGEIWETIFRGVGTRSLELKNAARLYLGAVSSRDFGVAISFAFQCLEALLLEKSTSDLLARLKEAVAYRIGTSSDDRSGLRDQIKKLYDIRSTFVHTGVVKEQPGARDECLRIAGEVFRREAAELST